MNIEDRKLEFFVEMSEKEIEIRREIMRKLHMHEDLTIEELLVLRGSLQSSDAQVRILSGEIKRNKRTKRKFIAFRGK